MVHHQSALAEWRERGDPGADPQDFKREILPAIKKVSIRSLIAATGLSEGYCYRIRRGEVIPHPRHWLALQELAAMRRRDP